MSSTTGRAKPGTYSDGSVDVALDIDVPQQPVPSTSDNGGRMTTGATAVAWAKCPDCKDSVGLIRGTVHLLWRLHARRIGSAAIPCRRSATAVCEHPPAGDELQVRSKQASGRENRTGAGTCNGMHARLQLNETVEQPGGAA